MDAEAVSRPRFKSSVEPVLDPDDGLILLCEGGSAWMPGRIFAALAPLLDGECEVGAIFEALAPEFRSEVVFAALDRLRRRGLLADDAAPLDRSLRGFWEHAGAAPALALSRLNSKTVTVRAIGEAGTGELEHLLLREGLPLTDNGDLCVVVTDDYLRPELADWNYNALSTGTPWLLAKPTGIEALIGPIIVPGETACWECLAQRMRWHRRIEAYAARRRATTGLGVPQCDLLASRTAVLAAVATEIVRWVGTDAASALSNTVISSNILTFERRHHPLIRRPQCPACGSYMPDEGCEAKPVRIRPRPVTHVAGGGHRGADPASALGRLERHLSPITGIVGAVETGDRAGPCARTGEWLTPNFAADHNFSDMHDDRFFLREGLRRRSGGKGKTAEEARTSALGEALERYCGVFDGTEPSRRSTFDALGDCAVEPNSCMLYSPRQYSERAKHNMKDHKAHWVPEPFRRDLEIAWTPLWSLTAQRTRYLPSSYCYFGYRSADPVFARADSNGCAAGSVLEEAVLQGFLELVERDAVAIWWYNRLSRPGIDLASSDDPYVAALVRHYREIQRKIWVLDITSDFQIPAFAALSKRIDKPQEDIIYGFGAHLDSHVALIRALTEMNQSLEAVPRIAGGGPGPDYRGCAEAVQWWRTVRTDEAPYLVPDPIIDLRAVRSFPDQASRDLGRDIEECVARADQLGVEVLVLDQTRPDVGVPVVRVVAPGLRHFWARFGPGRLYDVPIRQGWLERPTTEDQLNPNVIQF